MPVARIVPMTMRPVRVKMIDVPTPKRLATSAAT